MKEETSQAMAARLAWVRKDKKLSLKKMGDILGYSDSAITLMENGKRPILERFVQTLVERLYVNRKWLETGEGDPYADNDSSILTGRLAEAYSEGGPFKQFADIYLSLSDADRAVIAKVVDQFALARADAIRNGTPPPGLDDVADLTSVEMQTAAIMAEIAAAENANEQEA